MPFIYFYVEIRGTSPATPYSWAEVFWVVTAISIVLGCIVKFLMDKFVIRKNNTIRTEKVAMATTNGESVPATVVDEATVSAPVETEEEPEEIEEKELAPKKKSSAKSTSSKSTSTKKTTKAASTKVATKSSASTSTRAKAPATKKTATPAKSTAVKKTTTKKTK